MSLGFVAGSGAVLTVLSLVSIAVLSVFTGLLLRAVRQGRRAACPCFGGLGGPVSARDVARNAALIVVSLGTGAVGLAGLGALPSLAAASWSDAVWAGCLGVAVIIAATSQRTRERPQPLGPLTPGGSLTGAPVPEVELVAPSGHVRTLPQLVGGRAVFLIFTKAGCWSCEEAARRAADWAERLRGVTVMVATSADASQLPVPAGRAQLMLGAGAARRAFGVAAMPAAVLLSHDGSVASELVEGLEPIEEFVAAIEELLPSEV